MLDIGILDYSLMQNICRKNPSYSRSTDESFQSKRHHGSKGTDSAITVLGQYSPSDRRLGTRKAYRVEALGMTIAAVYP